MNNKYKNIKWFSLIEILIAILIFWIWLVSIYSLIISSIKINDYNKNYIIASNLAREQIEQIRNIRDTNFKTLHKFNQINPKWSYLNVDDFFQTWSYYRVYNNYDNSASFPINIEKILNFWEWIWELKWKMESYQLCLNKDKTYSYVNPTTYNCPATSEKTLFYKYVKFEKLKYMTWGIETIIPNWYKVSSKVIWYIRNYHEFQIDTIITDWKRL